MPFIETNEAHAKGYHASEAGQGGNPYPEKSKEYYGWNIGWRARGGF